MVRFAWTDSSRKAAPRYAVHPRRLEMRAAMALTAKDDSGATRELARLKKTLADPGLQGR